VLVGVGRCKDGSGSYGAVGVAGVSRIRGGRGCERREAVGGGGGRRSGVTPSLSGLGEMVEKMTSPFR